MAGSSGPRGKRGPLRRSYGRFGGMAGRHRRGQALWVGGSEGGAGRGKSPPLERVSVFQVMAGPARRKFFSAYHPLALPHFPNRRLLAGARLGPASGPVEEVAAAPPGPYRDRRRPRPAEGRGPGPHGTGYVAAFPVDDTGWAVPAAAPPWRDIFCRQMSPNVAIPSLYICRARVAQGAFCPHSRQNVALCLSGAGEGQSVWALCSLLFRRMGAG